MKITRTQWNAFSTSAAPISRVEFSKALAKIWSPSLRSRDTQEATIGLAISGGVDSMALAVLCSQLQQHVPKLGIDPPEKKSQERLLPDLRFRAFVVDHDVRIGSDLEAQAVSKVLEERGIPTNILKISWPPSSNPKEKQGFESLARKWRFRALGQACRDLRINSLLLAHHEDDQAETVLMRMLSGHRLAGLVGIRERAEIPENQGIYGVHESGGGISDAQGHTLKENNNASKHQLMYEDGGIQIYRPMLEFSKARLIATCEAEEMRWFEDHTNKDPSLTTRNAIRHMFANHKLPAALSKPSLLALSASARERIAIRKAAVDRWLSADKIKSFDTRSGTLTIRFPHIKRLKNAEKRSVSEKKQIAAEMLKRVLMLVTPEEHIEVSSLHGAIARLFPEIELPDDGIENDDVQKPSGFTIAGVQFQPETPVLENHEQPIGPEMGRKPEWFLSRQPLHSVTLKPSRSSVDESKRMPKSSRITNFGPKTAPTVIDGKLIWSPIFEQHRISEPFSEPLLLTSPDQALEEDSRLFTPIKGISHLDSTDVSSTQHPGSSPEPVEITNLGQAFIKAYPVSTSTTGISHLEITDVPPGQESESEPVDQLKMSLYRTPKRIHTDSESVPAPPTDLLPSERPRNPRHIYFPASSTNSWSDWSLFDNRYWVRVFNPTASPVYIKHFTRTHLTSFRNSLSKPYRQYVQDLLKSVAPGNVRWTLPVLVKTERAWGWDEGEWLDQVVALPTLGVKAFVRGIEEVNNEGDSTEVQALEHVMWEVRYKKINLGGILLSKDLIPISAYAMDTAPLSPQRTIEQRARSKCTFCGSASHVKETCWTAHPELKPVRKQPSTISMVKKTTLEADHIQGEGLPGLASSTKKKILKRVAWLKVQRTAMKKARMEKNEKRQKRANGMLDLDNKKDNRNDSG